MSTQAPGADADPYFVADVEASDYTVTRHNEFMAAFERGRDLAALMLDSAQQIRAAKLAALAAPPSEFDGLALLIATMEARANLCHESIAAAESAATMALGQFMASRAAELRFVIDNDTDAGLIAQARRELELKEQKARDLQAAARIAQTGIDADASGFVASLPMLAAAQVKARTTRAAADYAVALMGG